MSEQHHPFSYEQAVAVQRHFQNTFSDGTKELETALLGTLQHGPASIGSVAFDDYAEETEGDKTYVTAFNGQLDRNSLAAIRKNGQDYKDANPDLVPAYLRVARSLGTDVLALGADGGITHTLINNEAVSHLISPESGTLSIGGVGFGIAAVILSHKISGRRQLRRAIAEQNAIREHIRDEVRGGITIPNVFLKIDISTKKITAQLEDGTIDPLAVNNLSAGGAGSISANHTRFSLGGRRPEYHGDIKGSLNISQLVKNTLHYLNSEGYQGDVWGQDEGLAERLKGASDLVTYFLKVRAEYDRNKRLFELTEKTGNNDEEIRAQLDEAQIAVLGLATGITQIYQRGHHEAEIDRIRSLVASFGDPATEAGGALQTELEAFKTIAYTAMLEKIKTVDMEKVARSVSEYFIKMHRDVRSVDDVRRCYEGFFDRFGNQLALPKWEEAESQIITPLSMFAGESPAE